MEVEAVFHVLIAFLNLATGAYVLFKRPRNLVHRSFFIFTSGIFIWCFGMFLLYRTHAPFLTTVTLWGGEFTLLGFVLLAKVFPTGQSFSKRFLVLLLPLFILIIITPSRLFIASVDFSARGYLHPENGSWFFVFALVMAVYVALGIGMLTSRYRTSSGREQIQFLYLFTGASAFILAGSLFDIVLPAFHVFDFNLLGPIAAIFFVIPTAYAIARHQLMDIEIIVKRGIAYALTLFAIAGIFFSIEFVIEKFFFDDQLVDIVAGMIGGLLFVWIRRSFERATDRIFFRRDYDYEKAVRDLGSFIDGAHDMEHLAGSVDRFLAQTAKPAWCLFVLTENGAPLFAQSFLHDKSVAPLPGAYADIVRSRASDTGPSFASDPAFPVVEAGKLGIAAIIPFGAGEKISGSLLLGKKLSDAAFDAKDKMLFVVLAHQVGMAAENILLYRAIERRRSEQESQSKSLADVAHELQTPVAILKANMEVVNKRAAGDRKTALRVIEMTLDRMSQMIAGILAAARLNFSKDKLHKIPIEMQTMLEEIYDDCLALVEDRNVALFFSSEKAGLSGDPNQLRAVIFNLISNALKHTPGGGNITLWGVRGKHCAEIGVSDTGTGIPAENLPHIFERFYRIHEAAAPGTGIGLDLCKNIIEAHNGTIRVESREGQGSTFIIELPLGHPSPIPLGSEKHSVNLL